MCCTCQGQCNHTGEHVYCWQHGGNNPMFYQQQYYPYYSSPSWWVQPCDHCLCLEPEGYTYTPYGERNKPHMKCCHCGKLYEVSNILEKNETVD